MRAQECKICGLESLCIEEKTWDKKMDGFDKQCTEDMKAIENL